MPGPFGATGIEGSGSELLTWDDTAPDAWFSQALGLPVVVENDANAAAMAERIAGVATGLDTYAFLYFGTGLGLGFVQKGRLIAGAHGNAGEIGHIPVPAGGRTVPLESMVSRLSVQRALHAAGVEVSSGDEITRLYAARDPVLHGLARCRGRTAVRRGHHRRKPVRPADRDPRRRHAGRASSTICWARCGCRGARSRSATTATHPRLLRGASGRMTATLGAAALVLNQAFTPQITAQISARHEVADAHTRPDPHRRRPRPPADRWSCGGRSGRSPR